MARFSSWLVYLNQLRNVFVSGAAGTVTGNNILTMVEALKDIVTNAKATATNPGIVELATSAEAIAGTDAERAVTPAALKAAYETGFVTGRLQEPGKQSYQYLRIAAAVVDGETVTIGDEVYEFDTADAEDVTEGNFRVDVHGDSTVKSQGTLTVDTQPTVMDTMTIGDVVYTFKAPEDTDTDGEISIGTDLATAQANIVAAVNGTDGINTANPYVTMADFAADAAVLTAIEGGTAGDLIATTETFTAVTNVFDAATLGTTTAGADATGAEAVIALVASINANSLAYAAVAAEANVVLVYAAAVGDNNAVALATTMAGAGNAWDGAALLGGAEAVVKSVFSTAHVPTAGEVTGGFIHFPLSFLPELVQVQVVTTATGVPVVWDGAVAITTVGGLNFLTISNAGATDWAVTDTIYVLAVG